MSDIDQAIFVFTMHMLPHSGMSPDPMERQGQLSPVVLAFDYVPTSDDLKRAFMDINGFNTELFGAHVTLGMHGFDRYKFIAEAEKHRAAGTIGFFSSGASIGPWVFRCTRIPLRTKVALDGVRAP